MSDIFFYGAAVLLGLSMWILGNAMDDYFDHPNVGRRPPEHPPGWKNVKRKK